MTNQLAGETSPYLLQHAENPVDWRPWGPEALAEAKRLDRPIFLSVGYSACHWCHVMERESFEDRGLARTLNDHFICIKVDREERPDLDQLYMQAVQMMTRHGGWPMSVFLTPELQPFFAGTYWPPTTRGGMPGFDRVLAGVIDAWQKRRDQVVQQAASITESLQDQTASRAGVASPQLLDAAERDLLRLYDDAEGGFGAAPKFPHSMALQFLLRRGGGRLAGTRGEAVARTLEVMADRGLYDHLGGGFHRYCVDGAWAVPHFEKMLYDNALLASCYAEAAAATGEASYRRVARETYDFVLRDLLDSEGAFHSTLDADSEGIEGKYYVWTPEEVAAVLGSDDGSLFCRAYGVTPHGNFEGATVLHWTGEVSASEAGDDRLANLRGRLLAARGERIAPAKDDKVITAWNGLMIHALARSVGVIEPSDRYVAAAERAAEFFWTRMRTDDGGLFRTWRLGRARHAACLDDYAALANGMVSLYEATFHERWIDAAVELAEVVLTKFRAPDGGGFFFTASDHEALIARQQDVLDSSTPSGSSLAATLLLRLGRLCGRGDFLEAAGDAIGSAAELIRRAPTAAGQMLLALDWSTGPAYELALVGEGDALRDALAAVRGTYLPHHVLAVRGVDAAVGPRSTHLDPLFAGKSSAAEPSLYVCREFACEAPDIGVAAIYQRMATLASPRDE